MVLGARFWWVVGKGGKYPGVADPRVEQRRVGFVAETGRLLFPRDLLFSGPFLEFGRGDWGRGVSWGG